MPSRRSSTKVRRCSPSDDAPCGLSPRRTSSALTGSSDAALLRCSSSFSPASRARRGAKRISLVPPAARTVLRAVKIGALLPCAFLRRATVQNTVASPNCAVPSTRKTRVSKRFLGSFPVEVSPGNSECAGCTVCVEEFVSTTALFDAPLGLDASTRGLEEGFFTKDSFC